MATSGEVTVHYEAEDHEPGLRIGQRLRHGQFGLGEVRGWQGSGNDLKVTVRFPTVGVKTILLKFLQRA